MMDLDRAARLAVGTEQEKSMTMEVAVVAAPPTNPSLMTLVGGHMKPILFLALGAAMAAGDAEAATHWRWQCAGPGFEATGEFTTEDKPGPDGYYSITGVTGEANGVPITAMQPAKTAIPGNEGWPVDNLIRKAKPQLSPGGFGVALADVYSPILSSGSISTRLVLLPSSPTLRGMSGASRGSISRRSHPMVRETDQPKDAIGGRSWRQGSFVSDEIGGRMRPRSTAGFAAIAAGAKQRRNNALALFLDALTAGCKLYSQV
jgi:hypothetical protein